MRGGKRDGAGRKLGSSNKEPKADAKRAVVRVRLSDEERANISDCLKVAGKTESDFIRGAITKEISSTRQSFAVVMGITGKKIRHG